MKATGITIETTPKAPTDTTLCKGVWDTKDTKICCDPTSLKSAISRRNDAFVSKWGKYMSKIVRVRNKLMQFFKKIDKSLKIDKITTKAKKINDNASAKAGLKKQVILAPATQAELDDLRKFVEEFETRLKDFKANGKNCFETMKTARANIFCSACISSAAQFLSGTPSDQLIQYKIPTASCDQLLSQCYSVWKFNFQVNQIAQTFITLNSGKKSYSDQTFISQKDESTTNLDKLKEYFRICSISGTTLTCTGVKPEDIQGTKNNMCSWLFAVNQSNAYVEGDETVDSGITDQDIDNADLVKEIESTTGRRVLQADVDSKTSIGVVVSTSETGTVTGLFNKDSGLVPASSIDLTNVGEGAKRSNLMSSTAVAILAIASVFAF